MKKTTFPLLIVFLVVIVLTTVLGWKFIPTEELTNNLFAVWGDNSGGRESYTLQEVDSGVLGDTIIFNSIKDGAIGNEKNFVSARLDDGTNAGKNNIWNGSEITVEDGAVYLVRAYIHNNSPLGFDAVAENVKVAFNVPEVSAKEIPVYGFIFCDNTAPSEYWDGVTFVSDNSFHLEYIYGSAFLENNGVGKNGGRALSDEIVAKAASNNGNNGVLIGYSSLDGKIPGGFQFASYVTLKVRVVFDYEYVVEAKTRLAGVTGSGTWNKQVEANIGDEVEIQVQYRNTSEYTQENVAVKSYLPSNLEYVPGSTRIYNVKYDGASIVQDAIVTNGIIIGNYTPGSNVYIRFTAKVVDVDLADGTNTLINWTQYGVGDTTLQDYITVVVNKTE